MISKKRLKLEEALYSKLRAPFVPKVLVHREF